MAVKKEGESEGVFRMITSNQNIINHIITEDVDHPIKIDVKIHWQRYIRTYVQLYLLQILFSKRDKCFYS